jgi:hypothetical protein
MYTTTETFEMNTDYSDEFDKLVLEVRQLEKKVLLCGVDYNITDDYIPDRIELDADNYSLDLTDRGVISLLVQRWRLNRILESVESSKMDDVLMLLEKQLGSMVISSTKQQIANIEDELEQLLSCMSLRQ